MKQYQKAQMIAKNLPSGSYAAGCPENQPGQSGIPCNPKRVGYYNDGKPVYNCRYCERAQ